MASGRGGTQRVLTKLKKSIENGNYYEAHQMYRTLHFRYLSQKKATEAVELLYNGALLLLTYKQFGSGSDLSLLLIGVLTKASIPPNDDVLRKVAALHRLMRDDSPERLDYIASALSWIKMAGGDAANGDSLKLHRKFAQTFWREKNYVQARYHFVHSEDGEGCAAMLVEYQVTVGFASEVDLFIAQAVLQYLCLRNKTSAKVCFDSYLAEHPQVGRGPPFVRPLLNFLWLLLIAVNGDSSLSVFSILCEQYQTTLKRDPTYNEYLYRIGQLFFGLPPTEQKPNKFFGNILQNLFGADDGADGGATGGGSTSRQDSVNVMQAMDDSDLD